MSLIQAIAVDAASTRVFEDSFSLRIAPLRNTIGELIVACIMPPPMEVIDFNSLCKCIERPRRLFFHEQLKPSFVRKEQRLAHSFKNHEKILGLCATYRISTDKFNKLIMSEGIETHEVILLQEYDHCRFMQNDNFTILTSNIEEFLQQNEHTWRSYSHTRADPRYKQLTRAELLIRGMLDMFNRTCSEYAFKQQVPTLSMSKEGNLSYGVHEKAIFNGPLRKGRSFVNLTNLVNHLYGEEPYFTWRELKNLGINFKLA